MRIVLIGIIPVIAALIFWLILSDVFK